MKTTLSLCLLLVGCLASSCTAQSNNEQTGPVVEQIVATGPARSIQEIQELRKRYHTAVVDHDGPGLLRLVLPQASLWVTVLTEQSFDHLKQIKPETAKVHVSTFQQFAGFLNSSKSRLDPQSSNLNIMTDGTIGTVYFDFKFLMDGAVQNEGSETWQVVNTEDGWKIAAITYSSKPPHRG